MEHRSVVRKLKTYHEKIITIKSILKRAGTNSEVKKKVEKFQTHAELLFEICCCRCPSFDDCFCTPEKKVPEQVQIFLTDQRSKRLMRITSNLRNTVSTVQVRKKL